MCPACWPKSPAICRNAGVSIESMIQRGRAPGEPVAIVMITHETPQSCGGARLEGDRRLGQGARASLHDSHGGRVSGVPQPEDAKET